MNNKDSVYKHKRLDKWFFDECKKIENKKIENIFPNKKKYWVQLEKVIEEIIKIINESEKGALLEEFKSTSTLIYLNDHGVTHIEEVLTKVSELLDEGNLGINLYEAYILIFAIYLHDSGNIHGRKKHEKKCSKVMTYLGAIAGHDDFEKLYILSIASAHGGYVTGTNDKDKIGKLSEDKKVKENIVRYKILAAILRLGDELADSRGRESLYQMNQGSLNGSEIYHHYSHALITVTPGKNEIKLNYELCKKDIIRKYKKEDSEEFLIDEIKNRTLKMFKENIYCMRFLRPSLDITKIICRIEIFENFDADIIISEPIKTLDYVLRENGYPIINISDIPKFYPDFAAIDGQKLKDELT